MSIDALFLSTDINYKIKEDGLLKDIAGNCVFSDMNDEHLSILSEFNTFGVTDSFSTPLSFRIYHEENFKEMRPPNSPAYIYIRLPKYIEIKGVTSHGAGLDWKLLSPANLKIDKIPPTVTDPIDYDLYRISIYRLFSFIYLFIQCAEDKLENGKKIPVYFWLQDGNFKSEDQQMTLEMVKLLPAKKKFNKIFIGSAGGQLYNFFKDYKDFTCALSFSGLNMVNTWAAVVQYKKDANVVTEFVKSCNSQGISVIDEISPFDRRYKPFPAMTSNGKPHEKAPALFQGKDSPSVKLMLKDIREIVASGISGLTLDDEMFNHAGDSLDFSQGTKTLFKDYLADKYPDLAYVDPLEIIKNKQNNEKLYNIWIDFKCDRVIGWYRLYREAYENALKEISPASSTSGKKYFIPTIINLGTAEEYKQRLYFNIPELAKYLTHIAPMIYTYKGIKEAGKVGDGIRALKGFTGLDKNIITPVLLGGHGFLFGEIPRSEMAMVKYEIFECLMNQSPGFFFWATPGFMNPLVLKEVISAIDMTVPYERFFTDGTPATAHIIPASLRVNALKSDKQILLYASNYDGDIDVDAKISINELEINKITDIATGKEIRHSDGSFFINFKDSRGRLFLLDIQ